jgi:hypothetical protein
VPVFRGSDDVAFWLRRQERDLAVVFAARAALRVIPLLAPASGLGGQDEFMARRHSTLLAFRCVQAAWAVSAYPGQSEVLRPAAQAAGSNIEAGSGHRAGGAVNVQTSAEWAAAAAGTNDDSRRFTPHVVSYVLGAATAGRDADADILNSCSADADLLDQGFNPVSLALSSTLWSTATPDWAFEAWAQLERALLDAKEDWEVWTNWYEARLKGAGADQTIEVARATIPNAMWDRGAKVVNSQIQSWYEKREIWPRVPAKAPAASGKDNLERALGALSLPELSAVGVRAALRALPLMSFGAEPTSSTTFLKMLRVVSLTWAAAAYPSRTPNLVTLNAARVDAINSGIDPVRAIAAAAAGYSPNQFGKIVEEVTRGIRALRSASAQSDGEAGALFDLALSQDLNILRGAPNSYAALASVELWPGGAPPAWIARRWDALRPDLPVADGWQVWLDWYNHRLAGHNRSEAHELAYVEVPDELWAGGPAAVNMRILRRLDELENQSISEREASGATAGPEELIGMPEVNAIPPQASVATQFAPTADGRIDLAPDPPGHSPLADAIQREQYLEVRHKALDLAGLGHNQLGDIASSVDRFLAVVPENIAAASTGRLWSRGNTLRCRLEASDDADANAGDMARLPPLVVGMLRDLVETYNVFIIGDPKGRELDQVRLGPQELRAAKAIAQAAFPIVEALKASVRIATADAVSVLVEQSEAAKMAPIGVNGDQAVALAGPIQQRSATGRFLALKNTSRGVR